MQVQVLNRAKFGPAVVNTCRPAVPGWLTQRVIISAGASNEGAWTNNWLLLPWGRIP